MTKPNRLSIFYDHGGNFFEGKDVLPTTGFSYRERGKLLPEQVLHITDVLAIEKNIFEGGNHENI